MRKIIKKILGERVTYSVKFRNLCNALRNIKSDGDFFEIHPAAASFAGLLSDPVVCFDVGANYGGYTYYLSKKFPQAKIYSFEPVKNSFHMLPRMADKFKLKNVSLEKIALGDENKISRICVEDGEDAKAFVSENEGEQISLEKLDSFVLRKGIKSIDFIKIDVEGFEGALLRGASRSIKKFKPIVLIEISQENLDRFKEDADDIIKFLEKIGYTSFPQPGEDYLFVPHGKKNKS